MLHVSFAMTSEAFADGTKTETRRFWKPAHAAKFRTGVVFMGITKDFRAGGVRMHPARVLECYRERLSMMSGYSFSAEGGTRYWANREAYIEAMGGPDNVPWVLRFEHLRRCQAAASLIDGKCVHHDKGLYPAYCILEHGHEGEHKSRNVYWPNVAGLDAT